MMVAASHVNDTNRTCASALYSENIVIWASIVQCFLAVLAVVGNLLVIYTVTKIRRLRTITNYYVVSLAAADLLVALNVPFYDSFYFVWKLACNKKLCLLRYWFANFAQVCSALSLVGVSADRYVAIVHGISYNRIMTLKLAIGYITFVWVFVFLYCQLPFLGVGDDHDYPYDHDYVVCDLVYVYSSVYIITTCAVVLVTAMITLVLYILIFHAAWKQLRLVASREDVRLRVRQEARTACTMAMVLAVCVLGYVPYFVLVAMCFVVEDKTALTLHVKPIVICFYYGKSALNPVIYGWRAKDFRSAFRQVLFKKKTDRSVVN
ncbi:adenosine receptor A2a-like [Ornithodoros turicata]|uniref:adenosine receptor A2a-like n=1 Tax=Ornithodoros turicata TaxID=34597 RepID=UPI003138966B